MLSVLDSSSVLDPTTEELYAWVMSQEIKAEGAKASQRGKTRYDNPYEYGTKEAEWWCLGFEDPRSVYVIPF